MNGNSSKVLSIELKATKPSPAVAAKLVDDPSLLQRILNIPAINPTGEYRPMEYSPSSRYIRYNVLLGRGACKRVYRGLDTEEGKEIAWNQVELMGGELDADTRRRLFEEIHVLQNLQHKNIISFYDWWFDQESRTINFITELFTSGTLRQHRRRIKILTEHALKRWMYQVVEGLLYLHGHTPPIVHRDLKCDNIFINSACGTVKIGDLGLATAHTGMSVVGTPEFMAPEVYDECYDERVDIYSLGMCLLELATQEYPYAECHSLPQIFKKVTTGVAPQGLNNVTIPELRSLIQQCIRFNPQERPSARDLIKHPWFDSVRRETSNNSAAGSPHSSSQLLALSASRKDLRLQLFVQEAALRYQAELARAQMIPSSQNVAAAASLPPDAALAPASGSGAVDHPADANDTAGSGRHAEAVHDTENIAIVGQDDALYCQAQVQLAAVEKAVAAAAKFSGIEMGTDDASAASQNTVPPPYHHSLLVHTTTTTSPASACATLTLTSSLAVKTVVHATASSASLSQMSTTDGDDVGSFNLSATCSGSGLDTPRSPLEAAAAAAAAAGFSPFEFAQFTEAMIALPPKHAGLLHARLHKSSPSSVGSVSPMIFNRHHHLHHLHNAHPHAHQELYLQRPANLVLDPDFGRLSSTSRTQIVGSGHVDDEDSSESDEEVFVPLDVVEQHLFGDPSGSEGDEDHDDDHDDDDDDDDDHDDDDHDDDDDDDDLSATNQERECKKRLHSLVTVGSSACASAGRHRDATAVQEEGDAGSFSTGVPDAGHETGDFKMDTEDSEPSLGRVSAPKKKESAAVSTPLPDGSQRSQSWTQAGRGGDSYSRQERGFSDMPSSLPVFSPMSRAATCAGGDMGPYRPRVTFSSRIRKRFGRSLGSNNDLKDDDLGLGLVPAASSAGGVLPLSPPPADTTTPAAVTASCSHSVLLDCVSFSSSALPPLPPPPAVATVPVADRHDPTAAPRDDHRDPSPFASVSHTVLHMTITGISNSEIVDAGTVAGVDADKHIGVGGNGKVQRPVRRVGGVPSRRESFRHAAELAMYKAERRGHSPSQPQEDVASPATTTPVEGESPASPPHRKHVSHRHGQDGHHDHQGGQRHARVHDSREHGTIPRKGAEGGAGGEREVRQIDPAAVLGPDDTHIGEADPGSASVTMRREFSRPIQGIIVRVKKGRKWGLLHSSRISRSSSM